MATTKSTQGLSLDAIVAENEKLRADRSFRVSRNAVTTTGVDKLAVNRDILSGIDTSVSTKVDDWAVANQKRSGRCWIFAGMNMLRGPIMKETKVKDFELSQTFVHFWDKLEKANYFLEAMDELRERDILDRTVAHLLQAPIEDGGQWNMLVALINKYGIVPQYAMPDTNSSTDTRAMNRDLSTVLRRGAYLLREAGSDEERKDIKKQALEDAYRILTIHLGTPPTEFVWQYRDKDDAFTRVGTMTPLEFKEKYVKANLDDYVCVVNDPRHAPKDVLTVEYLGNVAGAQPVTYLNADISVMKKAVAATLAEGTSVWFGCDTTQQAARTLGVWDAHLLDYEGIYGVELGMDKQERVVSGDSLMTHAMVFTGVDEGEDKAPRRWRVENSWGPDKADKGFWTMNDSWFDEYVFAVAVRRDLLPDDYQQAIGGAPIVLPVWDPMGALA
ncbi:MAG: C1 family peptidase [Corynebacterium glucuronolyticum]|nr:C1 family peptidase [Corynebacterium glucuronolyticum]MDD7586544.1 C1 family peptidase [Mycobacteriaceae bacterium]MDY5834866.1 C1 family peptidase [Corynebacterium glucuronolyticum]